MYDKYVSAAFILSVPVMAYGASIQSWLLIGVGLAIQSLGWGRHFFLRRRLPPA